MTQLRLEAGNAYAALEQYLRDTGAGHILLVCGKSVEGQNIYSFFQSLPAKLGVKLTRFSEFHPNPDYADCEKGATLCREAGCDSIIVCGGGSAMDVAKCISIWTDSDGEKALPILAIPTTAGSGSEATRFAVIYKNGEKVSITDERILPRAVMLDATLLDTLPQYQRRSTMMDALCHAIESYLSVGGNAVSRAYAMEAIRHILENAEGFLANAPEANQAMLESAFRAGMAINLSRTTAAHAMAYKLTTKYNLAHGHAVALCLDKLWNYMKERVQTHPEECSLAEGAVELQKRFEFLEEVLRAKDFTELLQRLGLFAPEVDVDEPLLTELASTVNLERLTNHPMRMNEQALKEIYKEILG